MNVPHLNQKLAALWNAPVGKPLQHNTTAGQVSTLANLEPIRRVTDGSKWQDVADFLADVIAEELKARGKDKDFEQLACAVLLAALVGIKCGVRRNYAVFEDVAKDPGVNVLRARRRLLEAITKKLDTVDLSVST